MAKLTNAQLAAENAALRTELNTLRTQLRDVTDVASALNNMSAQRPRYVQPQWQIDRAACMAAAKAQAMSGHCVVRL